MTEFEKQKFEIEELLLLLEPYTDGELSFLLDVYKRQLMNVVDLILVAILACVTLHFYFRKKKKALSSGKEKEKPIREVVRKEGQERACPVICVVFQRCV